MRAAISSSAWSAAEAGKRQFPGVAGPSARRAEALDLSADARGLLVDVVSAAATLPAASEPHALRLPADGYWRGEVHRVCDRPAAVTRLLEEAAAAGVEQVLIVTASPEPAGAHAMPSGPGRRPRPAGRMARRRRDRGGARRRALRPRPLPRRLRDPAGAQRRAGRSTWTAPTIPGRIGARSSPTCSNAATTTPPAVHRTGARRRRRQGSGGRMGPVKRDDHARHRATDGDPRGRTAARRGAR